jgi:hypothetical protein
MEQTISDLQEQVRIYHSVKETGARVFLPLNFFAGLTHAVLMCQDYLEFVLFYLKNFLDTKLAF